MDGWDGVGGYLPCPALQATTLSKRSKEIMPSCCALESSPPNPQRTATSVRVGSATPRVARAFPTPTGARHGTATRPNLP
jgi:hypothetical protein